MYVIYRVPGTLNNYNLYNKETKRFIIPHFGRGSAERVFTLKSLIENIRLRNLRESSVKTYTDLYETYLDAVLEIENLDADEISEKLAHLLIVE